MSNVKCQRSKVNKGFTLIEMLIVIAIIAILSSVFLVGLRGFRSSAYDARRLSDLQKVQSYLEVYYSKYRCYPHSATAGTCASAATADAALTWDKLEDALVGGGIVDSIPNDPIAANSYYYGYSADEQSYVLGAKLTEGHSSYNEDTIVAEETYGVDCDGETIFCIKF